MEKALSIRQPWAWLIAAGLKDIENRNWWTHYRGLFYIHAPKTQDDIPLGSIFLEYGIDPLRVDPTDVELQLGGLIGRARIVDCVKSSPSKWFEGPFGFKITDAEFIDFVPCRGALGFFPVSMDKDKQPCLF